MHFGGNFDFCILIFTFLMYDLIIIGAGPAGLAASIYASRYKLKHLIIGEEVGGQIMKASRIENWPGEESITGMQLAENFRKQAEKLGGEIINIGVDDIEKLEGGFRIVTDDEKVFEAKTIIFALGMKPRKMNLPKEDEFIGKGISYCATCDAMFFKKKDVVIIGGGDSAATAALHLAEFANSVQLLYKNGTKIFEPVWEERMLENGKITLESFENILEIIGESKIEGIAYEIQDGQRKELKVQGIFIEIGSTPGAVIAKDLGVETDEHEFIIVKSDQSTNIEGVYAAGDITTASNKLRQIVTAAAEGAIAASSVYKTIKLDKK